MIFPRQNTPLIIPTCVLWLDGNDPAGTGIQPANGSAISSWVDKSGFRNNATQGTGAAQPSFSQSAVAGKSVIAFDGGDYLALPSALYSVANGDNIMFIVAKRNTETAALENILAGSVGTTVSYTMRYLATAGSANYKNRSGSAASVSAPGVTNTAYQILRGTHSGTTLQNIRVNGANSTTNSSGQNVSTIDSIYIGSDSVGVERLIGRIAEIIIYKSAISAANITYVEQYLANKYGIAI